MRQSSVVSELEASKCSDKKCLTAGGKPYKKSQFYKLYNTYYSRNELRFKNTKIIDQIIAYRIVRNHFRSQRMRNSLES